MYTALAQFYDMFMDIDYRAWADWVIETLDNRKTGVDIACGSGKFTRIFKRAGLECAGVDISAEMLNIARTASRAERLDINYIQQDMTQLELLRKVDFATILCDGVNYVQKPLQAFQSIYNNLNNGAILIFDISSEYKLVNTIASNIFSQSTDAVTYIWRNYHNKRKNAIDMELDFFVKTGDSYTKSSESQTQYIHKTDSIRQWLEQVGFKDIRVYNEKFNAFKRNNSRAFFVAYK